ncbi:hypothetical protein H6802_04495 [Candidatus Nomurabacteria bacterium]|uniref:YbaK/aminoacyl-tRNA synthetase-associated domain-containing protein n=1 Tax=candidate division WWE3 bacterium TaxID=2053526 RepID=A0A955DZU6_UNCKA|nr:hypothetical protein [candidate division WWE3 bacterium]MCB9824179.1 hypothetical protein [Candidatus Nomurabacteria bacterium]MCB9826850.1 hypothetical protein [Candidatus Nomurabacteria bacterium]MCB9828120.1 hypothetical protein [Candidatus Nomurabacteria bacterium]HXK52436.1 YbaK/EbsC family protein [bacterium]
MSDKKVIKNSKVLLAIKKLLSESGVEYKMFEHEPVWTSEEASKIRGTPFDSGAKALVLYVDDVPSLFVLPGSLKADFNKIKKLFMAENVRLATPVEVEDLTGLVIGSIPPFGSVMGLHSYFDSKLLEHEVVAFNIGAHTASVIMKPESLMVIEKPKILDFSI